MIIWGMKKCECGCEEEMPSHYRPERRFIYGHACLKGEGEPRQPDQICACGCGKPLAPYRRYTSLYLAGHHLRGKASSKKIIPLPEEIPSGICECGCGGKTEIAPKTRPKKREFEGYPMPYMSYHSPAGIKARAKMSESPRWKGGRTLTKHGYIMVNMGEGKVDLEHRVVMANELGRPLTSEEEVHHLNGNRNDNRVSNLELWIKPQPTGIRASDHHCLCCIHSGTEYVVLFN